ncbi:MAG: flagellar FlbD family protein [Novipirellula sp. JB048]
MNRFTGNHFALDRGLFIRNGERLMIKLTRLDGEPFVLNADLIRYVERRPDTFVTLTSGDRLVVQESLDEVIERAVAYQQRKHSIPAPRVAPHAPPP